MPKKLLLLVATSVLTLTGCSRFKEVGFEKFKEEVLKIKVDEMPEIKEVQVKGTVDEKSYDFVLQSMGLNYETGRPLYVGLPRGEEDDSLQMVFQFFIFPNEKVHYQLNSGEEEGVSYYVGSGFKIAENVNGEIFEAGWNKEGYISHVDMIFNNSDVNLSLSYTYKN